jgi:hypothetical protein
MNNRRRHGLYLVVWLLADLWDGRNYRVPSLRYSNMHFSHVLGPGDTAKVRTSHGPTTEENLRAFRARPSAPAREEPKAPTTTTQGLAAADIRLSVVSVGSQLLSVGLRAIG